MTKKVFLAFLLLATLSNATVLMEHDSDYDPGAIGWWSQNWTARPIEVSTSNNNSSGVTLTFKIKLSTALPANGIVEVYFPASLTTPSGATFETYQIPEASVIGQEISVPITGVAFTVAGAHGPFRIYTRNTTNSQIKDMTNSFGSIFVSSAITADTNLTVSLPTGSSVPILTTTDLFFSFSANYDLYPHDILILQADNDWGVASTPSCTSVDVETEDVNYFKSVRDDLNLDCVSGGDSVYIYGLANDVDISVVGGDDDVITFMFKITGFTSPQANYPNSDYVWSVYVLRFGTRDIVRLYQGTGPETTTGSLIISSWRPYGSYPQNEIIQGLVMYTTVTFSVTNPLPVNGTVQLQFTNVDLSGTNWMTNADQSTAAAANSYCYVAYNSNYSVTCGNPTTNTVTLTFTSGLGSNQSVSFTIYTNFSGSSNPTVQGTSYNASSVEIDRSQPTTLITYATEGVLLANSYGMVFRDNNTGAVGDQYLTGSSAASYVFVTFELLNASSLTGQTEIEITLPANTVQAADMSVYLSNDISVSAGSFKVKSSLTDTPVITTDVSGQTAASATPGSNSISYTISDITGSDGIVMAFYNWDGAAVENLILPRVASNNATRYETYITAMNNGVNYVKFQSLSFSASAFSATTVSRLCGNTIKITLQVPFAVSTASQSRNYKLQFTFGTGYTDEALSSGLSLNEEYPHVPVSPLAGTTLTYTAARTLQLTGQSSYAVSTNYILYIAIGSASASNTLTPSLFYTNLTGDTTTKYVLLQSGTTAIPNVNIASSFATPTAFSVPVLRSGNVIDTQAGFVAAAVASAEYVMQLPQGFTFDNQSMQARDSGAVYGTPALSLVGVLESNSNPKFQFPAIIGTFTCTSNPCDFRVNGVVAAPWAESSLALIFGSTATCGQDTSGNLVTTGFITIQSTGSQLLIESRGPFNYHQLLTVTFTTANGIPTGGKIVIDVDANWSASPITSCSVGGLSNADGLSITCTGAANVWTIQGFAGFDGPEEITFTLTNMIPPQNSNATDQDFEFFNSIKTQYNDGTSDRDIDVLNNPTNSISVKPLPPIGTSAIYTFQTIPPNASEANADLFLEFSFEYNIPSGTVITITPPTSTPFDLTTSSNNKNQIFFSKEYTSAAISATNILITVAEDVEAGTILKLYVPSAITNPQNNASFLLISAVYQGVVTIVQDTNDNADSNHIFKVQAATVGTVDSNTGAVALTNATAGEASDYTLTFVSNQNHEVGHYFVIKFPSSFSFFITHPSEEYKLTKYQWAEPKNSYIRCSSVTLDVDVECIVEHRMIKVFNGANVNASTQVDVTIYGVANPSVTALTDNFTVYHYNAENLAQASGTLAGVQILGLPTNISIKSVESSNTDAFSSGDYSFEFFLPGIVFDSNDTLQVKLPMQYDTNLTTSGTNAYTCTIEYYNITNNYETPETPIAFSELETCTVSYNVVSQVLADQSAVSFDSTKRIKFVIKGVANPEWGLQRSVEDRFTWDFDANDSDVFSFFDVWTNQFQVSIFDTAARITTHTSYLDLNAAYLGYNLKYRGFKVYSSPTNIDDNRIKVIPGTQTKDLYLSTNIGLLEPLAADKVVFTNSLNTFDSTRAQISITSSEDNFTMYSGEYYINFRVSASIDSDPGIYYMNSSVEETKLKGAESNLYDPLCKTIIEVAPKEKAVFTVADIPNIRVGNTSRPIAITTKNSPHSGITINVEMDETLVASDISIQPAVIDFTPGVNTRYFTIIVEDTFDIDELSIVQSVKFTIGGTDSPAYAEIPKKSFEVINYLQIEQVSVTSVSNSIPTRNSISLQATSNVDGIFYWYVAPEGTSSLSNNKEITTANLKNLVGDYFHLASGAAIVEEDEEQEEVEVKPSEEDLANELLDSWTSYARRMYRNHLMKGRYAGAAASKGSIQVPLSTLDDLFAETDYEMWIFVQDQQEVSSSFVTHTFSTALLPEAAKFIATFEGDLNITNTVLREQVALVLGIQPTRLINEVKTEKSQTNTTSKETKYEWDIPALRNFERPTPTEEVMLSDWQVVELRARIALKDPKASVPTFSYDTIEFSDISTPAWTSGTITPESTEIIKNGSPVDGDIILSENSVTVQAICNTSGLICGLCLRENFDNYPNHNQVLLTLNQDNEEGVGNCIDYKTERIQVELTVDSLNNGTDYECFYMCFNNYPTWPGYVSYSSDEPITNISITTLSPEIEDEDNAQIISALFALIVALLF